MTALAVGLALQLGLLESSCQTWHVRGYLRSAGSAQTYDGTSIWTAEPIVAAHWRIPIDSYLRVEGLSRNPYRVADRGLLGPNDLDFPVDSLAAAYALTGDYVGCVLAGPP